jgi:predicted cytidylate kinase
VSQSGSSERTLRIYFYTFFEDLRGSLTDLSVIVGIIAFYQFAILRSVPDDLPDIVVGLMLVAVGLALFLRGLELGIFPLGEDLSQRLATLNTRAWILLFAFVIGFATTVAEPALIAIAHKAAVISNGRIDALTLRLVVAFSVGSAILLGVIRILLDHPIHWYIITGYCVVLLTTLFAPEEIVGLAYDSGGITTSTVTVPLIAALGIGLSTTLKARNPLMDGFGLIAFASVMPMIFVQGYGMLAYGSNDSSQADLLPTIEEATQGGVWAYFETLLTSIADVTPVALVILFFYFFVLRQPIAHFGARAGGFGLVVLGLYVFVIGLELGLFPIGESLAIELAGSDSFLLVYTFAFAVGFSTTIAEPALTAIAGKAEEISEGSIKGSLLRGFVAVGVGIGILLGAYRIVQGDSLVYYILVGYLAVIIMTYFAPRTIIPIAYDSGGVTTSTITVPIVAALGLGLATSIPGRDPLVDGFGLIAFASLFPMITVLGYGISKRETIRFHERRLLRMEQEVFNKVSQHVGATLDEDDRDGASGGDTSYINSLPLPKKSIVTITGDSGSGVSTVTALLAESLEYRKFNAGGLYRSLAKQYGISLDKLDRFIESNRVIDQEIDTLVRRLGQGDELVLAARLGFYWIHESFSVYLRADPQTSAKRVYEDIVSGRRKEEHAESVLEVAENLERRFESTKARYLRDYGIDISYTRHFDLVIETDGKTPEEVVATIRAAYRAWRAAR